MKRYWNIYKALLKVNFASLVSYHGSFFNTLLGSFSWAAFSIISMYVLTSRVHTLYGWDRSELLLLTGLFNVVNGINRTFFSRNIDRFSEIVSYGELDGILTKPIDSQWALSFWRINYMGVSRIALGVAFTAYILATSSFNITVSSVLFFFVLSFCGLGLLYSTSFIVITFTIWYPRLSNLTDFLYNVQGITRYPTAMFRELSAYIFLFVFPFAIAISVPAQVFFNKAIMSDVILLIISSICGIFISRVFWKQALKSYTSVSG